MKKILAQKDKIATLKSLAGKVNGCTVVSGSFDPFDLYYFRFLAWASRQSRPLIVLLHTDEATALRRGFNYPYVKQSERAAMLASLSFVDRIVITNTVAHDTAVLKLLRAKIVVLPNDNTLYRRKIRKYIAQTLPNISVKYTPFVHHSQKSVTLRIPKAKNDIARRLIQLAINSRAKSGKISALLKHDGKIIAETANSEREEHAEILIIRKLKHAVDSSRLVLYILIPPCLMCAKAISLTEIKEVRYLFSYGSMDGSRWLSQRGITTVLFDPKEVL